MAAIVAVLLFLIPGFVVLALHGRLDGYRTDEGKLAQRGVGRWAAWREHLRAANYRSEGRPLLRWYTVALVCLQFAAIASILILTVAYP